MCFTTTTSTSMSTTAMFMSNTHHAEQSEVQTIMFFGFWKLIMVAIIMTNMVYSYIFLKIYFVSSIFFTIMDAEIESCLTSFNKASR